MFETTTPQLEFNFEAPPVEINMRKIYAMAKFFLRKASGRGLQIEDLINEGWLAAATAPPNRKPENCASEAMKRLARNTISPVSISDYAFRKNPNPRADCRVIERLPAIMPGCNIEEPATAFPNQ